MKGPMTGIGHSTFYGHRKANSNKFPQINKQAESNNFTNTNSSKE